MKLVFCFILSTSYVTSFFFFWINSESVEISVPWGLWKFKREKNSSDIWSWSLSENSPLGGGLGRLLWTTGGEAPLVIPQPVTGREGRAGGRGDSRVMDLIFFSWGRGASCSLTFALVTAALGRSSITAICRVAITPRLCTVLQHMLETAFPSQGCSLSSSSPCFKVAAPVHPCVEVPQPASGTGPAWVFLLTQYLPQVPAQASWCVCSFPCSLQRTGVGFDDPARQMFKPGFREITSHSAIVCWW